MESGNGGVPSKGFLIPVPDSSDVLENSILAPLHSAYLNEESRHFFSYSSAFLVKNPVLEEKYNHFRANRRQAGYTEEDLKESYGFLLFDNVNKANALGETGVLTGNSKCTTLGDPTKGIYISMYSDCLDLNRWYNGRSGYIAIIRLTQGKVNKVLENYTQNFTQPTVGFDCHVSEQLHSVSSQTSSFLAFERTQYYMYELLDDESKKTAPCPSGACPLAIVSFSYTDTKATAVTLQNEKSEVKNIACPYLPWRGKIQVGSNSFHFGLRSTSGAFIPSELPPVIKVDKAISMVDLRHLLPKAVFETSFTGEAFLEGLYCSLCELVSSEVKESSLIASLLAEIKEKDVALTIPLNDGGFLVLLHSSHLLAYDDCGTGASDILQGIFVFPHSRVAVRETKVGPRPPPNSSEILRYLPALSYAEGEVEKTSISPNDVLCDVVAQHMQSYATLINPGLESFLSRDISISPDQFDVANHHKRLYLSPEWNSMAWQSVRSYLSKPASFQLPLSKASDVLVAGQEEQRDDLDEDDVFICQSSPEAGSPASKFSDNQLLDKTHAGNVETSLDCSASISKGQIDVLPVKNNFGLALEAEHAAKDEEQHTVLTEKSESIDVEAKKLLPVSDDLPTELIVSITSAEKRVGVDTLSVDRKVSATKPGDLEFSGFLNTAKDLHTKSGSDKPHKSGKVVKCSKPMKATKRILQRSPHEGQTPVSATCAKTASLHACTTPGIDDLRKNNSESPKDLSGDSSLRSHSSTNWRKASQFQCKSGDLSFESNEARTAATDLAPVQKKSSDSELQSLGSSILMELEAYPMRRKTERWDLKPVISKCGRFLVPYGSVDIANKIISIKKKMQASKREQYSEGVMPDASTKEDTEKKEQEESSALEPLAGLTDMKTSLDDQDLQNNTQLDEKRLQHVNEGTISGPLNQERDEHLVTHEDTDLLPSQALEGKQTDFVPTVKLSTSGEALLCKLESVLLKGKRKHFLSTEELSESMEQDEEPILKKGRAESEPETMKGNLLSALVPGTDVKDVSSMVSVDLFAYALGLTPKETRVKLRRTESQESLEREGLDEKQKQNFSDKQPQFIQRPPSIFPRRGRIKTLKKHQGISEECIKKKWWLHFQTPAFNAVEKRKHKDTTRDKSLRKTVKERANSACSSADGLNLLADLALGANSDRIPPQPNPALERKPETSSKKGDFTSDFTKADQETLLHALLRQPSTRATQPPVCHPPSQTVGSSELLDLLSKEHAYSLPPSSFSLLGLPGTPFQVYPVSDSTRLLRHQAMNGDKIKTLHPSVSQEDQHELNGCPENLKRRKMLRQKFRYSRTFGYKGESLQVTRHWQENYNFDLDSKFTSDIKSKTINRALHGPWDFSIQDTDKELRLIIHMWIGLFYSRSTARLFHLDSNLTCPCSEESDSLVIPCGVAPSIAETELKGPSSAHTSEPSAPRAWDLSKKDNLECGRDAEVLDLSLRNSTAATFPLDLHTCTRGSSVSNKQEDANEILNMLKPPGELCEASTYQSHRMIGQSLKHSGLSQKSEGISGKNLHEKETGPYIQNCEKYFSQKESDEQQEIGVKDARSSEINQDHSQEVMGGPSGKGIYTVEDSQAEQLDVICGGLENQMPFKRTEPEMTFPDHAETIRGVDSCHLKQREAIESNEHSAEKHLDKNGGCTSNMKDDTVLDDQPLKASTDEILLAKGEVAEECSGCEKMDELSQEENITAGHCDLPVISACLKGTSLTDENASSEVTPQTPSEILPTNEDFSAEKATFLTENAEIKKVVLPMYEQVASSPSAELHTDFSLLQTKHNAVMEIQRGAESDFTIDPNGVEHEPLKTKFADRIKGNKSLIPFIDGEISGDDDTEPQNSLLQQKSKDMVQDREEKLIITQTTYPEAAPHHETHRTSLICNKKVKPSSPTLSLYAKSETFKPVDCGSESDNRCPTPTIDEKPYDYILSATDGRLSHFRDDKIYKDIPQTCSCPPNEIPEEHKLCKTSGVWSNCGSPMNIFPDIEKRTFKILQSVRNILSESNHSEKPNTIGVAGMTDSLEETFDTRSFHIRSSAVLEDGKIGKEEEKEQVVTTVAQDLHTDSSAHTDSNDKLEHSIGVELQVKNRGSLPPQHWNGKWDNSEEKSSNSVSQLFASPACLQANKPSGDQQVCQTKSQPHIIHEYWSHCQKRVMAVTPSKIDENQVDGLSENSGKNICSKNQQTCTKASSIVLGKTEKEPRTVITKEVQQSSKACDLSSIDTWLMNYRSKLDKAEIDILEPPYAKGCSDNLKGDRGFLSCRPVEDVKEGTDEAVEMDYAACSNASVSFVTHEKSGFLDDSITQTPRTSLACTISNVSGKRPITFLEQLSNRCRQADLTQESLEQECLIFLDKMKQLVKKSKKEPICQQESCDELRSSCSSPLTVHFSCLEEQDDSLDLLDTSLLRQKIKVDMSNKKTVANSAKARNCHPKTPSQSERNPVEYSLVSDVTAECTRLFEAAMDDICAVRKVPSKPKKFKINPSHPKAGLSNHFDFCDQMKREMDEKFRSTLNSVVKKSCKTKYRFFILWTSDDVFFEETKAQLEAEDHIAVSPSEFFIDERLSSLLIILRNEDIAEHICQIPQLLELKKSSNVLFAGIDEPDDIFNLTHQELFTRGGFIVIDKAVLEPLSLCKMKKISEILQELNPNGKWKWMLHYRDSRRLKENARLSLEAKEKQCFLHWAQDAGTLEVLPYHECDLMSRDQPDYLTCLVHLQIQNISARFSVFITETKTGGAYERNGILTMTMNSFLTKASSEIFTV